MRGLFFGYTLSEIAVLTVLLVAVIPLVKSVASGNIMPLLVGVITFLVLKALKVKRQFLSLGPLLVALFFVPPPHRGARLWERFEDGAAAATEAPATMKMLTEEEAEEANDENEAAIAENFSAGAGQNPLQMAAAQVKKALGEKVEDDGPAPIDLKDLGEKLMSTEKKRYRLPSEKDDGEHYIDSSTTFMNAYKQLKPEQITALTADTQKLISVQKDLMGNLNNLKPLINDGKEIMKTFKSFFGSDPISS